MAVLSSSQDTFQKDVLDEKGVVFVDFYADWCGPCKMTTPIIEELSENKQYKDVSFVKVDVDKEQELASKYNILSIPTFVIFKNGKVLNQFSGARDSSGFES